MASQDEEDHVDKLKETWHQLNQRGVLFCLVERIGEDEGMNVLTPAKLESVRRVLRSKQVTLCSSIGGIPGGANVVIDNKYTGAVGCIDSLDDLSHVMGKLPLDFFASEFVTISGTLFPKNKIHTEKQTH